MLLFRVQSSHYIGRTTVHPEEDRIAHACVTAHTRPVSGGRNILARSTTEGVACGPTAPTGSHGCPSSVANGATEGAEPVVRRAGHNLCGFPCEQLVPMTIDPPRHGVIVVSQPSGSLNGKKTTMVKQLEHLKLKRLVSFNLQNRSLCRARGFQWTDSLVGRLVRGRPVDTYHCFGRGVCVDRVQRIVISGAIHRPKGNSPGVPRAGPGPKRPRACYQG